jgi:hypothetical protein
MAEYHMVNSNIDWCKTAIGLTIMIKMTLSLSLSVRRSLSFSLSLSLCVCVCACLCVCVTGLCSTRYQEACQTTLSGQVNGTACEVRSMGGVTIPMSNVNHIAKEQQDMTRSEFGLL